MSLHLVDGLLDLGDVGIHGRSAEEVLHGIMRFTAQEASQGKAVEPVREVGTTRETADDRLEIAPLPVDRADAATGADPVFGAQAEDFLLLESSDMLGSSSATRRVADEGCPARAHPRQRT